MLQYTTACFQLLYSAMRFAVGEAQHFLQVWTIPTSLTQEIGLTIDFACASWMPVQVCAWVFWHCHTSLSPHDLWNEIFNIFSLAAGNYHVFLHLKFETGVFTCPCGQVGTKACLPWKIVTCPPKSGNC